LKKTGEEVQTQRCPEDIEVFERVRRKNLNRIGMIEENSALRKERRDLNAETQSTQRNRCLNGYIKKLNGLRVSALGKERKM